MMRLRMLWVGRTKSAFLNQGIEYYLSLLKGYAAVSVIEIKEEKGLPQEVALAREGVRIMKKTASFVLLDEGGRQFSSVDFAGMISRRSGWDFVMGGPFGVAEAVREQAELTLSLSRMTLTHEMARLVLLEQVFRCFTIIRNRGYHH